jgi:hypothetical protein
MIISRNLTGRLEPAPFNDKDLCEDFLMECIFDEERYIKHRRFYYGLIGGNMVRIETGGRESNHLLLSFVETRISSRCVKRTNDTLRKRLSMLEDVEVSLNSNLIGTVVVARFYHVA